MKRIISKINTAILVILCLLVFGHSKAESATTGSFRLTSSSTAVAQTCEASAQIIVNTAGQQSNGADIQINFDPSKIEIIDSNPSQSGIQIQNGIAYEAYFGNSVDMATGTIRLTGASFSSNFSGEAEFATIRFKSKPGATSGSFTILFSGPGATTDSNIAEASTSSDLLGSVQNISFTFSAGSCTSDGQGPQVNFQQPTTGTTDFPSNGTVIISISDPSGINLDSCVITINDDEYVPADPEVTYSGSTTNYTFQITPRNPYPPGTFSIVTINCRDMLGNLGSGSLIFNLAGGEICESPTSPGGLTNGSICVPITNTILDTPVTQTLVNTVTQIREITNRIVDVLPLPPVVKEIIKESGIPGFSTLLTLLSLIAYSVFFLLALEGPKHMLYLIGFLFGKRNKDPWGVIVDKTTAKPLAFATVRAYLEGSKSLVAEKVSDLDGRYGFILSPGKYRLEILHSDYFKEVKEITISETETINFDIFMTPLSFKPNLGNIYRRFVKKVRDIISPALPYIFAIGFFSSAVSSYFNPIIFNVVITLAYAALLALSIITKRLKVRKWGSVYDSESNLLVPRALVKLFNRKNWSLMDTQVTDERGRFGLFVNPGDYALLVSAPEYKFPSKKQKDLGILKEKYQSLLELNVKEKKKLNVDVYLDPKDKTEKTNGPVDSGNPFG